VCRRCEPRSLRHRRNPYAFSCSTVSKLCRTPLGHTWGVKVSEQLSRQYSATIWIDSIIGLAELDQLYVQFRDDLRGTENKEQQSVLLAGLSSISQTLYPVQLHTAIRELTEAENPLLAVAATVIPQEGALTKDDLEAIRDAIESLRALVEGAEISPTVRRTLLELIRLAQDAIARFNIYGARGLRRAFKAMLGETAELYGLENGEGRQEELKRTGAWAAVVKLLKAVDSVASKLLKYKPLIAGAAKLLFGSSDT
jgi:hypothetical protein